MLKIPVGLKTPFGDFVRGPAGIMVPISEAVLGQWKFTAKSANGDVIGERVIEENLVTTQGRNHMLSVELDAATQITAWYLFLTDGTPTVAAADTFASHAGWVEVTAYGESVRQTWTGGTASAGSISNAGSEPTFTINANGTTIGGAGLGSVSTKGSSSGSDILFAAGAFTGGDIVLNSGSTLEVTATFSLTSS